MESPTATLPVDALPHPPGRLPIVGEVAGVDRRRPAQHELKLAQRGLGPIFGRKLLGTQLIIVAAADWQHSAMTKQRMATSDHHLTPLSRRGRQPPAYGKDFPRRVMRPLGPPETRPVPEVRPPCRSAPAARNHRSRYRRRRRQGVQPSTYCSGRFPVPL